MANVELTTPLADLPRIPPKDAEALAHMGLTNVGRLVAHLPMRHEREEAEAPIAELAAGAIVSARGEVSATRVSGLGRARRFEAVLHDGTGRLDLVWFNQAYLKDKILVGMRLRVQGTSKQRGPGLQLANPRFEVIGADAGVREGRLRPVYPATAEIDSRRIEKAVRAVLDDALPLLADHLQSSFRREREMPSLADAHRMMHRPESETDVAEARRRLAYDELLLLQLGVQLKRAHRRRALAAPALGVAADVRARIEARLPFALTEAQRRVVDELCADLALPTPANRLVQGDVGSGKTVVAVYAMLLAVAAGHQATLMAPTELLAEQHAESIGRLLEGSRVRTALLTGGLPRAERERIAGALAAGEIDLVIGTHALLSEGVAFRSLAVAVIDEQHRFGVHQRARLRSTGTAGEATEAMSADGRVLCPHQIVMTATPIPRTLAMTLLGDLDVSTIDALPPGRKPVKTRVVRAGARAEVYTWLAQRVAAGEQAFVVAPAIGDGEEDASLLDERTEMEGVAGPLPSVRRLVEELGSGWLSGARLAVMHGRMARAEREHVMGRFRAGLFDVLVATTVIEVGVDVPNASVMVIEGAERFGLAQLHQLRGRVGRGERASVCVLIASDESAGADDAQKRLTVMETTASGFDLAERDLEIRGPGELFGTRQSGLAPLEVADLSRDLPLLAMARKDAAAWVEASAELARPEDALARRRVLKRYGRMLGLGDVG